MDQVKVDGVSYRRLVRKCGKNGCRCNTPGKEHGPYWYAYDGMSPAKYVGVNLPEHIKKHLELLKKSAKKIKAIRADVQERLNLHRIEMYRAEKELHALSALEAGEYAERFVLDGLGLGEFFNNGKGE